MKNEGKRRGKKRKNNLNSLLRDFPAVVPYKELSSSSLHYNYIIDWFFSQFTSSA
jgi:hypothetical protein